LPNPQGFFMPCNFRFCHFEIGTIEKSVFGRSAWLQASGFPLIAFYDYIKRLSAAIPNANNNSSLVTLTALVISNECEKSVFAVADFPILITGLFFNQTYATTLV